MRVLMGKTSCQKLKSQLLKFSTTGRERKQESLSFGRASSVSLFSERETPCEIQGGIPPADSLYRIVRVVQNHQTHPARTINPSGIYRCHVI